MFWKLGGIHPPSLGFDFFLTPHVFGASFKEEDICIFPNLFSNTISKLKILLS